MITEKSILAKDRIFSGIQPSGDLHIGNYLGAIKSWVELIEGHPGIFCIVDYHAITVNYDKDQLAGLCRQAALTYLACGLSPEKCIIFVQSRVPEHTELSWILSTLTPLGLLERMTQFKDKTTQHSKNINLGLLAYPVLQAADILLYNAKIVPVGEDQEQHLELTREISRKFNNTFGSFFVEPETYFSKTPRIMGIYGKEKMSKSKDNHIPIFAPENKLRKTINKCTTDTKRVTANDPGDPKDCPLFTNYHKAFSGEERRSDIIEGCTSAGLGCGECKAILFEAMNSVLAPFRERKEKLLKNPDYLDDVLEYGAKTARSIASQNMAKIRQAVGLR